jgi:threonyl-tRNA synthetase
MSQITITLPDGTAKQYPQGTTAMTVATDISEGLARNVLSAKVNGTVVEALRPINEDATVQLLTWRDDEGKNTFWHSSAHLMAEALEALYPGIKLGIGPAVENGFYYDVDLGPDRVFSSDDFKALEDKMVELARTKSEFVRTDVTKQEALDFFTEKGDEYKLELIRDLEDGTITFYKQGNFTDLCRGPHLASTAPIKAVKIMKTGGAYWRGDESRDQLTRIYGVSFPKAKELKEYLALLEEAKKRDHRKLGQEMELFMFSEKVGAGLPMWLPKGTQLRERLINYLKVRQADMGYQQVTTPHIGKKDLYVTSGHYAKYGEDSFQPIKTPRKDEEFLLKPMNCPHHCEMYKFRPHSYKELPIRFAEFGTVYRYEQTGELHGLSRVRGFTQDDAHIFCMPEQVQDEFLAVVGLTQEVLNMIGFDDVTAQISLRDPEKPEKYIGSDEDWNTAEKAIIDACAQTDLKTVTAYGEAAFYGPKLDFMVRDALGRSWQLGTVQVDYQLPQRFELEYIGADNAAHRPVMIHRAPFGSLERFTSILIEHTGGNFPLWLAPEQFAVLPISDRFNAYAKTVQTELAKHDIIGEVDDRSETIGRKIRDAELRKVPFMLIVGENEASAKTVGVRKKGEGDLGAISIDEFVKLFQAGDTSKESNPA